MKQIELQNLQWQIADAQGPDGRRLKILVLTDGVVVQTPAPPGAPPILAQQQFIPTATYAIPLDLATAKKMGEQLLAPAGVTIAEQLPKNGHGQP